MQVSDYMSKSPVTVSQTADYDVAFGIMDSKNMHHLPVVDENDEVVGILARRDLQLAARYFREAPVEVSEVMHTPVETIAPDAPLAMAARQMVKDHIGCLPVMEDGKHVIGMLTETDLFRALTEMLDAKG
ncbi:MAG: CBS domain-containing protein [Gammaproteobacteria bacterium]|nr:CBS domain-containing protein [Gammaproteobacteria bacterium]